MLLTMNKSGNNTILAVWSNNSLVSASLWSHGKHIELLAWIGLTIAISFTGIFFNIAAFSVTFLKRAHESIFNILMSHFVAINFFICLVNLPIHAFMVLAKENGYKIPPKACGPIQFFFALGCAVCNWADVCLSVNRFVAIVCPMSYKWWTSKWVNLAMVAFGWSICTAATLPMVFGYGGSMPLLLMGQCGFMPTGKWGMLITCINSYIPYGIIASASLAIWIKILWIQRANSRMHSGDAVKPTVISRRRLVVARMLLMTTVWRGSGKVATPWQSKRAHESNNNCAICNLPWGIIQFNFPIYYSTQPISILWLRTIQAVQYGYSPIVLYLTNEDYRKRFQMLVNRALSGASRATANKVSGYSGTGGTRSSHGTGATNADRDLD